MNKVLIVTPHPDDETLGCSGAIQRHKKNGDIVYWLILTEMKVENGWKKALIEDRKKEIAKVNEAYSFDKKYELNLSTGSLDQENFSKLITKIGQIIKSNKIDIIYTPFIEDIHTDHNIASKVIAACSKWFRYPSIKKILMYETLSETNFNFMSTNTFKPNTYFDISKYIKKKIKIFKIYKSENGAHPFPRSIESINSLALLRGSESGFNFAEAFILIFNKE
jgi:LmbE family N-acetylglucosaminyl deacetylase